MRLWLNVLWAAALVSAVPALAQSLIDEDFRGGELDWENWCPCQMDMEGEPVAFPADPEEPGDHVARIVVNEASLGGNKCRSGAPNFECRPPIVSGAAAMSVAAAFEVAPTANPPESLGPSLVRRPAAASLAAAAPVDPYCTDEKELRAHREKEEDECIQRQELRLAKRHGHAADDPHLYSLRFRMPATIADRTHSIRWVTAQWKQEPVSENYEELLGDEWGPSPFLAQRFDDGVLHVTVQDEHCRCKVASAPYPDGSNPVWTDGKAEYCESTQPDAPAGQKCPTDLQVKYGANPVLSTALGSWVEMSYRVEASRSRDAVISVYEGNRLIVEVTGKIGYEPSSKETSVTKFKIGHYRDYMPSEDAMEIDWVRVTPAP
jgi:hypothetical protein